MKPPRLTGPEVSPLSATAEAPGTPPTLKIVSWNLLRTVGASLADVEALIARETPDLMLMQEATSRFNDLPERIGGHYAWAPLPGRIHGLAMWSPLPWRAVPSVRPLPPGSLIQRVCQIVEIGDFGIANVHLSHGQRLNRRQLRAIALHLPERAAVLGDFNLVGPCLIRGFRDVGPRRPTHMMGEIVPVRLDRCLVRGLACEDARVLPRTTSDHRPIAVRLAAADVEAPRPLVRYRAAAAGVRRRAASLAGFGR
ncbi:endonuclease/exonuclease/phosphatase family protein [Lichenibacterium ramalinae]|uniref:Endonuclease/exonuclease/phosphatase family protein n=1 Tax=Lichenibacterium ramalinae TaxID=2316527 RepID=A0A4Q2RDB1_9HYPH|nr:endonuclease/exonuclease/phosphatase family protein [Lichenibacterium ramalinae]RYB03218.1 endonuclease/exonuclease/phosphatase family protein [Lichenibacterium ramalinae]